jgi:hypothetical protein
MSNGRSNRLWLFEPDLDALVGLLRAVASDPTAARLRVIAASEDMRRNFTWERTADAVERRPGTLAEMRNQPRMITDAHGWDFKNRARDIPAEIGAAGSNPPSHPCSIRVSSVAQESLSWNARTSLTMIVRNEENNISSCLSSVAGLFDEIVVIDTGSTDRTWEIAQEFGARVFDFVWVDDFAAARNAALARATGDYAFWLDADDFLDPPEREKLRGLLRRLGAGSAGGGDGGEPSTNGTKSKIRSKS